MSITGERLQALGLKKVGEKLLKKQDMKARLAIAYEFFRVASKDVIKEFDLAMQNKTKKILAACPKCKAKGKEDLLFHSDEHQLKEMQKRAKKSKLKAKDCGYCQGTGAENMVFDKLRFQDIKDYDKIPPEQCLFQLEVAQKRECFDTFEVADVETVEVRPDPIIFGRIKGCEDRFFITQWDDDIDINEILKDG